MSALVGTTPAIESAAPAPRPWSRWLRDRSFAIGMVILGVVALLSLFAPLLTPYDPTAQDLSQFLLPPSREHPLGTDHLGRDVWARLLYGGRIDLAIGVGAVLTPFVVGTLLGSLAGFYGGRFELAVSGTADMVQAFPYYVLIIALVFVLGAGIPSIFVAMALVAWVSYARIVRGEVISIKEREFVQAARAAGLSDARILLRHILPNSITQAIVYSMSDVVVIIVGVVTLSYLGLGVPPPTPEWGAMIAAGQTFIVSHWWLSTIPGIAVIVVGLGFSLIGDGIAELLKPE
ncbi:MAG: appC [Thermomicrobiales bacterium]|nr:appC [Thermomicrobiales bacterium]